MSYKIRLMRGPDSEKHYLVNSKDGELIYTWNEDKTEFYLWVFYENKWVNLSMPSEEATLIFENLKGNVDDKISKVLLDIENIPEKPETFLERLVTGFSYIFKGNK